MSGRWPGLLLSTNIMSEVAPPPLGRTVGGNNLLADKRPEAALIKRQKLAACQNNVPPVHGRTNPALHVRTRLSNHQRNLSLDFRSESNIFCFYYCCIFLMLLVMYFWPFWFMFTIRDKGINWVRILMRRDS